MVQKEVMKKTRTYGLIGVLLAVLLVAMIYSYGVNPGISPLPAPSTDKTGSTMKTFTSYNELRDFLTSAGSTANLNYYTGTATGALAPEAMPAPTAAPTAQNSATKDYSTTNIQVAGVDEADTVKTDGTTLYVVGNSSQVVYILDANPQNARVLGKISFSNAYVSGIYLNGTKLAVMGNQYESYYVDSKAVGGYSTGLALPYWSSGTTFVYVYDVSNKADPVLSRNFTMSGNYVNSRMIGNYVYDIISQNAQVSNNTVYLPEIFSGGQVSSVDPTTIHYANTSDTYYSYTTIVSLDLLNDAAQTSNVTIMMGNTGTMYVSQSNIYITYPISEYQTIAQPTGTSNSNGGITIMPMPLMIRPSWQGTAIYRIQVSGASLTFAAQGNVTGNVLSQYSMDEYNGYFRIATTSYDYNSTSWWTGTPQNNLYILNSDLNMVSKIENLASGETLHAARFMGDRCYLVTFQQVDPLFVIDLSQPTNPQVLGNLTIPGYSDFLQPYDETHLIGIGQDVNASIDADKIHTPGDVYYTAILGLKVSLFDVTDVANPTEISHYVIGDRGTSSEALNNPKALLFDQSRHLLVLPVDLYLTSNGSTNPAPIGVAKPGAEIAPPMFPSTTSYSQFVWQGVYVFNVDLTNGLTLRGNVTQMDNASALLADPSLAMMNSYQWIQSSQFITRSTYIGNVLYTFSDTRVQLNSLDDFALLAQIDLN